MKTLFAFIALFFVVKIYSQDSTAYALNQQSDSAKNINIDKMPNALAGKTYSQKYVGNNGKGFNVYESQLDGMKIAKPDATFHSNMPTGNIYNKNRLWIKKENLQPNDSTQIQNFLQQPMLRKKQEKMNNSLISPSSSLQP